MSEAASSSAGVSSKWSSSLCSAHEPSPKRWWNSAAAAIRNKHRAESSFLCERRESFRHAVMSRYKPRRKRNREWKIKQEQSGHVSGIKKLLGAASDSLYTYAQPHLNLEMQRGNNVLIKIPTVASEERKIKSSSSKETRWWMDWSRDPYNNNN
jgi:hypothetical protein